MKKTFIAIACCTFLVSIATISYGAGPYLSGNIGVAIANDSDVTDSADPGVTVSIESDAGFAAGVALGYDAEFFRYELEFVYQKNNMDKGGVSGIAGKTSLDGDTKCYGVLLNGYFDIRSKSVFVPYLTAGIGYANVDVSSISIEGYGDVTSISYDDNVFAYQVGAGVGFPASENVTFDIKYRYFATSDPEFDDSVNSEFSSHNIYAGMRVAF